MSVHIFEKWAQWRKMPCLGEIPTPDEWLKYVVERLEAEGREELAAVVSECFIKPVIKLSPIFGIM